MKSDYEIAEDYFAVVDSNVLAALAAARAEQHAEDVRLLREVCDGEGDNVWWYADWLEAHKPTV